VEDHDLIVSVIDAVLTSVEPIPQPIE
jgi:hypothetical protein